MLQNKLNGLLQKSTEDFNWSGAILLDFVKVVDRCTVSAPAKNNLVGLTFDNYTLYDYAANCDTIYKWYFCKP